MKNVKDIIKAIDEAKKNGFTHFGVRTADGLEIGQELECSHDWDYEHDCESDKLLNGTCATGFGELWFDGEAEDEEAIKNAVEFNAKLYCGDAQYIIAGDGEEYGADEKEVIISNATVIAVVE